MVYKKSKILIFLSSWYKCILDFFKANRERNIKGTLTLLYTYIHINIIFLSLFILLIFNGEEKYFSTNSWGKKKNNSISIKYFSRQSCEIDFDSSTITVDPLELKCKNQKCLILYPIVDT